MSTTSTTSGASLGSSFAQTWMGSTTGAQSTTGIDQTSAQQAMDSLDDLLHLQAQYDAKLQSLRNDGITNAAGAPTIDGVSINFSPEDLAAALQILQGKTQDAQMRTAKEGLQVSELQQRQMHDKAMAKIDDWIKKSEAAASKQKALGILGWVAKIAAFVGALVGAVAATVATGGAASPLLAVAIIGLVGATISLASGISQEKGGPALEISALVPKLCSLILAKMGVPEDKLEAASKLLAGAMLMLVCPGTALVDPAIVGNMFGGIAGLSTDNKETAMWVTMAFTIATGVAGAIVCGKLATVGGDIAQASGKLAQKITEMLSQSMISTLRTGTTYAEIGLQGFQACTTISQAGVGMGLAIDQFDAEKAQVDKKRIDAMVVKLQASMEEDREQLKKVIEEIQQSISVVSQMINAAGESRSQIVANLGRSMA